MTKRDFFEQVIATVNNKDMVDFAKAEIAILDKKNEKAKANRVAKQVENEPIIKAITDYLTGHKTALANELSVHCGVSTSKIVAVANKMVENGIIKVAKVKVPKVGERNQYSL